MSLSTDQHFLCSQWSIRRLWQVSDGELYENNMTYEYIILAIWYLDNQCLHTEKYV